MKQEYLSRSRDVNLHFCKSPLSDISLFVTGFLLGLLTLEDGTERLSLNVGIYHYLLCNDPEERSSHPD